MKLRELLQKATPGPWTAGGSKPHGYGWVSGPEDSRCTFGMRIGILNGQYRAMADDATLIAYLRNNAEAIADLIDAAYALRNESMPVSKRSHVVRTALFTDLRDALAKLSEDA